MAQVRRILAADAVATMSDRGVIRDAGIVIAEGADPGILAVGELSELRRQWGELPIEKFGGLLLPAFVNAHTHLELSYVSAADLHAPAAAHFTQWVTAMMAQYPPPERLRSTIEAAVHRGVAASLRAGVGTVGDISRHSAVTRPLLSAGPLRTVSFGEIVSLGKMRGRLEALLAAAEDTSAASDHLQIGLSPHAPYTVELPALERIVAEAVRLHLPVAMHLAELADEERFLRDLGGPLGRDWDVMQKLDVMDDAIPTCDGGPLAWAEKAGLLGQSGAGHHIPVLLAHVNYCDARGLALLAASGAGVTYCPRTHHYFGHRAHPYRELLAAGVNVALATDSLASNPDLSPLEEARYVWRRDGGDPADLLAMITRRPAQALGLAARCGTLGAGMAADIVHFQVPPPADPLRTLLDGDFPASALFLGARRVL